MEERRASWHLGKLAALWSALESIPGPGQPLTPRPDGVKAKATFRREASGEKTLGGHCFHSRKDMGDA